VIAFGGRAFGDENPSNLNPLKTPVFQKKPRKLYGLFEQTKHPNTRQILRVESYMDVIVLAQHGITNAVRTLGTSDQIATHNAAIQSWSARLYSA